MLEATFAFYFELAVNLGLCGVGAFVVVVLYGNLRGVPVGRGVLGQAARGACRFTSMLWWSCWLLGLVWCLGWFGV